ncbi:MAG: acetylglucosamine-6-sulfatase [Blastopirellula sp.]|nr:MAG: acetylglucosamine-6-sulfatase [Blastopirellula sp.]
MLRTKLFSRQILLLTACCWLVSNLAGPSVFAAEQKQPNILFFFTDDQRFDTLGCAGHPIIKTPNIDRLAAEGVRFDNMFVSHSICWVSRTTILTGLTARSFGVYEKPDQAKPEAVTALYPDLLRDAGYRTAHIGKWHAKMPKGFSPKDHYDVFEPIFRNPYLKKQEDGSLRHETELIGDKAIEFIKDQPKDQPFSINLWFNASHAEDRDHRPGVGHFPWPKATDGMYEDIDVPAPRLNDPAIFASQPQYLKDSINRERYFWRWDTPEKYQTNIRAYFRMISGIDNVVGRVLKTVKEQGFADNTIVIYTADNGYYMGDRGFAGKWSHYEESLRVPLIVYDPRLPKSSRGKVVSQMAMNLDLPVSFLSWAGVDVPESYQGLNLVPLVQGATPKKWRKDMFVEHVTLRPTISWEGVRNSRYKYARYFDQTVDAEFLHDLQVDPDELKNFVNDPNYAKVLKQLRARTDELVNHYGAPLVPYKPQPPKKKRPKK